ncbi:MAG: acyl CoA:acetate/3-ketoacid CoA transferase [Marinobacter sp.]|uniref:acyl CoA:acetate/3-ketoacid CoA transferase n=1 Tax=Marinobacter sp. TaxID=50741 RepID=UPI001B6B7FFD|nr:CoA-transferase [Marinobacter sp.]MBQ0746579.1 acyl CoA:acetate/3-ketoacid CoA transferase [Marinobacter sp.]MBQ0814794.1 acyl CoA:acetate/3-ketoacid CoA transferase [Marinobacter sp.]
MSNKIVSPRDAAALVHSGDTITTSGFVGAGVPDALLKALGDRYAEEAHPRDLTLLFAAGQGDGKDRGLNRLAASGLVRRIIGGHWGLIPKLASRAVQGEIEGYNFPQGVISHLYRDIAAGKPGTISHVGLETFVDPRQGGGRVNDTTPEGLVELITVAGQERLFYHAMPIHVALLRGSTADEHGNVTMEREALVLDNLAQAMAARNSGGVVIVQVDQIAAKGSLPARDVVIPAMLVDAVVVAPPELHMQTYATQYNRYYTGRYKMPEGNHKPAPLDLRKVIARRAAFELPMGGVVNLGIGMPEGIAAVAAEEGLLQHVTLTAEPGVIGGQPASGLDFGAAVNTEAIIAQGNQFDFYDGGGLDMACLGMAEVDGMGNVNVSRFGPKLTGAGGFINISQNARHLVFAGTFTACGLDVGIADGALHIITEGRTRKFSEMVEQITFSGTRAARLGQPVLYVTERCVFRLSEGGVSLIEVAPGIDIERDILAHMNFTPQIGEVSAMDSRIFIDAPMGLRDDLLTLGMERRIHFDAGRGILFINLAKLTIRTDADIAEIKTRVEDVLAPIDRKVDVIVNYDQTRIDDAVAVEWASMVDDLEARLYNRVTRYSTSAFLRRKLGQTLQRRRRATIFDSERAAEAAMYKHGA